MPPQTDAQLSNSHECYTARVTAVSCHEHAHPTVFEQSDGAGEGAENHTKAELKAATELISGRAVSEQASCAWRG